MNPIYSKSSSVNTQWFPKIGFLELLYDSHTHFHNLSHTLRVWILANLLTQKYKVNKSDANIITAAALLHDVGRKRDFWDRGHGAASADMIDTYLPLVTDRFSSKDIEKIKRLCLYHDKKDPKRLSLDLKILKDADALDRIRLPRGRLDVKQLRLAYSHKLVDFAEKLYKTWRKFERDGLSIKRVIRLTTQKLHIYQNLPIPLKEQLLNIYSTTLNEEILLAEDSLEQSKLVLSTIRLKLDENELDYLDLIKLKDLIKDIENKSFFHPFLQKLTLSYIKASMKRHFRLVLFDHTYPEATHNEARGIFKQFQKQQPVFMYPQDEEIIYKVAGRFKENPTSLLFKALERNLTRTPRRKKLILLYKLSGQDYPEIVNEIADISDSSKDGNSCIIPRFSQLKKNPRLWIDIADYYTKQAQFNSFKGNTRSTEVYLEGALEIIKRLFDAVDTDTENYIQATQKLIIITTIARRSMATEIMKKVREIWQQDLKYMKIIPKFSGGRISYYANLFNIYSEDDNSIDKLQLKQLVLFKKLGQANLNIDKIVSNYILPLAASSYFDKVNFRTLSSFKKFVKDRSILENINRWQKILRDDWNAPTTYSHITKYTEEFSPQNTEKIISTLKADNDIDLEQKTEDTDNYKVIMNVLSVDVLANIAEKQGQILSIWNILGMAKFSNMTKLIKDIFKQSFIDRTLYRDAVQRQMNIRFPNITSRHGVYGSLENIHNLTENQDADNKNPQYLNRILHYPMYTFLKNNYGEITLIFNDEVKDRSIFVFLDSFWKFRKLFVDFKHAVKLKKLLSESLIKVAIKSNPLCLSSAYIEAIIFGEVTLKDVESIVVPEKIFNKNQTRLANIMDKYPHIEIIRK